MKIKITACTLILFILLPLLLSCGGKEATFTPITFDFTLRAVNDDMGFENGYTYTNFDDGTVMISAGDVSGDVMIPSELGGKKVTAIAEGAFKQEKTVTPVRMARPLSANTLYDENIHGDGKKVFSIAHYQMATMGNLRGNVVFDATNIDRKTRKDLVKKMRPHFDIIICKWFSTPLLTCKLRNAKRERQVPEEVLDRMWERFRPPMSDEGFDIIEEIKNYY